MKQNGMDGHNPDQFEVLYIKLGGGVKMCQWQIVVLGNGCEIALLT